MISSNKCKIFHRSLNVSVDSAQNIGEAYVILHNFVRKKDGFRFEDTFIYKGLHKTLFGQKHLAQEKHLWKYDANLRVMYRGSMTVLRPVPVLVWNIEMKRNMKIIM